MRAKKKIAEMFAALGDETRLDLIGRLGESGPLSIARLTEGRDITRQAVTKHLESLKEVGLVHDQRLGRETLWDLDERRLKIAVQYLELVSRQWETRLEALRKLVED